MATINPYLMFNGRCEEAFNFYKHVFGGEFSSLQRFKDGPPDDRLSADESLWIMHVSLPIGHGTVLMGSDSPSGISEVNQGDNFYISISTENTEETDKLFNGLSAGGKVIMPLEDTFWGARFGMLVDKFGIHWMVSQDTSPNT